MTGIETGTWHADDNLVEAYLRGGLDLSAAASLEAHLLACAPCRARLAGATAPELRSVLASAWSGVQERVEVPPSPWPVRLLRRFGLSEPTAVVLASARSMSAAWTLATVVVLGFAALAVFAESDAGRAVYLIVAPLVPVAGVVVAFGPGTDPYRDLSRATPYPPARLVLVRAGGVVVTSVPLAVAFGLAAPGALWLAFAWLAPALAFVLVVLGASTWIDPLPVGGIVALGWAAVVAQATRLGSPLLPVAAGWQLGYLALALVAALVLALRLARAEVPGGVR